MNKITSTLAGLALVAGASIAPAMAQGNLFSPPGTFTILPTVATLFSASGSNVGFNPVGSATNGTATFALTGTQVSGVLFQVTNLTVTPSVGTPFTETAASGMGGTPFLFTVVPTTGGNFSVASVGAAADGTTFNLVGGAPAVPEASTTVSFGALLALGGLAVVLRRKGVKNAA